MNTLHKLTTLSLGVAFAFIGCSESTSTSPNTGANLPSSSSIGVSSSSITPEVSSSSIEVIPASSSSEIVAPEGGGKDYILWMTGDNSQVASGGYWFGYDDANDDGGSSWSCFETLGEEGAEFDFCIGEESENIEVDFKVEALVPNTPHPAYGFAGVGFNLMEEGPDKEKLPYEDMVKYKGVKIKYSAEEKVFFQIVYDEKKLENDVHYVTLRKGEAMEAEFEWSDFEQAGWGSVEEDLIDHLVEVKEIKFQSHSENFEGEAKFVVEELILIGK